MSITLINSTEFDKLGVIVSTDIRRIRDKSLTLTKSEPFTFMRPSKLFFISLITAIEGKSVTFNFSIMSEFIGNSKIIFESRENSFFGRETTTTHANSGVHIN